MLGLPSTWCTIAFWLSTCTTGFRKESVKEPIYNKKCHDISSLKTYVPNPPENIWEKFPSFYPKAKPKPKINLTYFKRLIQKCWFKWDVHKRGTAKKAIEILKNGAETKLKTPLKTVRNKNAKSATKYGEMLWGNAD